MRTFEIHNTKTHLSRLLEKAAKGKPFAIAKRSRSLAKVRALDAPTGAQICRLGFLTGEIAVQDGLDRMRSAGVEQLFGSPNKATAFSWVCRVH